MTRNEMEKIVPFMQAYLNGECVQYNAAPTPGAPIWNDVKILGSSLTFSWWPGYEYRIKPKAREVWLVWIGNCRQPAVLSSEEEALSLSQRPRYAGKRIHVQHVIEEVK